MNRKKDKRYAGMRTGCVLAIAAALVSCRQETALDQCDLTGVWLEQMPAHPNLIQGIRLSADGNAESIGTATLTYDFWELLSPQTKQDRCRLVLHGHSIGNRQTLDFSDTLDILVCTPDSLVLGQESDFSDIGYRREYLRRTAPRFSRILNRAIVPPDSARHLAAPGTSDSPDAYCIFSEDSARCEIFMAGGTSPVLERRIRPDGISVWNTEDDDTFQAEFNEEVLIVSRRGNVLFLSAGHQEVIRSGFGAEEPYGNEYISVRFFPDAGIAELYLNGMNSLLRQYRTASGYGYASSRFDLRGKGTDAVLSDRLENRTYRLTEKKNR